MQHSVVALSNRSEARYPKSRTKQPNYSHRKREGTYLKPKDVGLQAKRVQFLQKPWETIG